MDPPGTGSSADGNGWVRLVADDFAAVVSRERLAGGAHASSMLRTLVELATAGGDGAGEPPTVRLDCSAEVARELVAALRQGARYTPPPEPRLARAVADAAAFLGVDAAPALPRGGLEPSEMVLLPSYWCAACYMPCVWRLAQCHPPQLVSRATTKHFCSGCSSSTALGGCCTTAPHDDQ